MPDFLDFRETLIWFVGAGGTTWWLLYWSDLVRNLREYDENREPGTIEFKLYQFLTLLTPLQYQFVVLFGSAIVPFVATVLIGVLPPETLQLLQPYYALIAQFVLAFVAQRIYFRSKTRPAG